MAMLATVLQRGYDEFVKGMIILLVILMGGYYAVANKVVMGQLKELADFYSNVDQISAGVSDQKAVTPPNSLYELSRPITK